MEKKLSESETNALIEDEWKAHIGYKNDGYSKLASDELRHYNFWLKKRKQWYGY